MEKMTNNRIEKQKKWEVVIPEDEFTITFSMASGPGGQNVNRRATKVDLRWNVMESRVLILGQKQKVISAYPKRIDKDGYFFLRSQKTRSQEQNRQDVIARLHKLVNQALRPVKQRLPTKPTRVSQEKRLRQKKEQSEKKKLRQKIRNF